MIPALTGFFTGFSIILAIGAQNAFVLRQGLLRAHVFWLCLLCSVSDAILIVIGVAGFGAFVAALPWLPRAMSLAGAAFLIVYGALRFRAALHGGESLKAGTSQPTLAKVLLAGAAFTWLTPHVYIDTLGIADRSTIVRGDALTQVAQCKEADLVLADPPYDFAKWAEFLAVVPCSLVVAEAGAPVP
ncbi:MAG: LysE family transporter, partial [Marivivens sp.]